MKTIEVGGHSMLYMELKKCTNKNYSRNCHLKYQYITNLNIAYLYRIRWIRKMHKRQTTYHLRNGAILLLLAQRNNWRGMWKPEKLHDLMYTWIIDRVKHEEHNNNNAFVTERKKKCNTFKSRLTIVVHRV